MIINVFKKLIEDNKAMLNEQSSGLFEDSIRCFDASIYRQAYLLAYQGFSQHIRNMVLNAKMPRCQRTMTRTNGKVFRQT